MIKVIEELKQRFLTGMKPTQQDIHDLIDTLADGSRLKTTDHAEATYTGSPADGEMVICAPAMERVTITSADRQGTATVVFHAKNADTLRLPQGCMVSGDIASLTASGPRLAAKRTYILRLMPRLATVQAVYSQSSTPVLVIGERRLLAEDGRLLVMENRP